MTFVNRRGTYIILSFAIFTSLHALGQPPADNSFTSDGSAYGKFTAAQTQLSTNIEDRRGETLSAADIQDEIDFNNHKGKSYDRLARHQKMKEEEEAGGLNCGTMEREIDRFVHDLECEKTGKCGSGTTPVGPMETGSTAEATNPSGEELNTTDAQEGTTPGSGGNGDSTRTPSSVEHRCDGSTSKIPH